MARPLPKPTETELLILQALWELGPATVRQVHEHLGQDQGYTTVLKMMQTMHGKGLLRRDESSRSHVYAPSEDRGRMQRSLMAEFMDKVFSGSALDLVQAALQGRKLSAKEKAEIQKLLKDKP
jgi:predicted transcriptional regulator